MSQNGKSHICPVDKRAFASKKALAQHRLASHVAAQAAPTTSKRGGRGRRNGNGGNPPKRTLQSQVQRTVSGSDIIGSFPVTTKLAAGTVVAGSTIVPTFFEGTRLHAESSLWTRWRPLRLQLEILSSAGAMTSGSFVSGWVADPDLWLKNDLTTISVIASFRPSNQTHISKKVVLNIPCNTTQKWYVLDTAANLTDRAHGKFVVALASGVGNITASSQFDFTVRLSYTVLFDGPTLPLVAEVSAETVYASAGYESYFTDSTSGWADGKICSLKHAAGGSLVEFDGLKANAIYQLDNSAKLIWYTAEGTKVAVRYMVKIKEQEKHVIVFQTLSSAREYVRTGNVSNGLTYNKAGEVIIPTNPAWFIIEQPPVSSVSLEAIKEEIAQLRAQLSSFRLGCLSLDSG